MPLLLKRDKKKRIVLLQSMYIQNVLGTLGTKKKRNYGVHWR